MGNSKGVLVGAAMGTLLGSLAIALYPNRKEILETLQEQAGTWAERAKHVADYMTKEKQTSLFSADEKNGYFLKGSLLGLFVGAGTALLLAPKSGKLLRNQIIKTYGDLSTTTQDVMNALYNGEHYQTKTSPSARTSPKKKRSVLKIKK